MKNALFKSMPGISSRHKKGPVRLPWGDRWPFQVQRGAQALLLPGSRSSLSYSYYNTSHRSRETYMFASSRAGNDPIYLCISNLAQTHRKNLAKVCYMKAWIDDWSFFQKQVKRHTLIIHSTLHNGDWADKRLKRWPWMHFWKPTQILQNWARVDT